jgi:hypothetical protein
MLVGLGGVLNFLNGPRTPRFAAVRRRLRTTNASAVNDSQSPFSSYPNPAGVSRATLRNAAINKILLRDGFTMCNMRVHLTLAATFLISPGDRDMEQQSRTGCSWATASSWPVDSVGFLLSADGVPASLWTRMH